MWQGSRLRQPDSTGWSLYGAPGSQRGAISGKSAGGESRENKRDPLPRLATGCRDGKPEVDLQHQRATSTLLRRRLISL